MSERRPRSSLATWLNLGGLVLTFCTMLVLYQSMQIQKTDMEQKHQQQTEAIQNQVTAQMATLSQQLTDATAATAGQLQQLTLRVAALEKRFLDRGIEQQP